jgi:hypothetical protein
VRISNLFGVIKLLSGAASSLILSGVCKLFDIGNVKNNERRPDQNITASSG